MRRQITYIILLIIGIGALAKLSQTFLLTPLIQDAYHGESFQYLNELLNKHRLKDPANRTLDFYTRHVAAYVNRLLSIYSLSALLILLIWRFKKNALQQFFFKPAPATNLAIFRIIFFGYLLYLDFPGQAISASSMSSEAVVPPPGWGFILHYIPVDPTLTRFLGWIFDFSCISGLLGFYSRTSSVLAAISGLWVMGVPEFFGKIDHYHFLWQFLVILGCSRCGDALSIDKLIRALRNPDHNIERRSAAYRIPFIFIWITIGLIYFFPGLWKFVFSGFEWAFSENLKFKMYAKWLEFSGWTPFFRIDHYPWLYQSAALSVILFELGFIFALPFRLPRLMVIAGGLLFHSMTRLFLRIGFTGLLVMYSSFINWDKLFKEIGNKFISPLYLFYDPQNRHSRQVKHLIKAIDIFGTVIFTKETGIPNLIAEKRQTASLSLFIQLVVKAPLILFASPVLAFVLVSNYMEYSLPKPGQPLHTSCRKRRIVIAGVLITILNFAAGITLVNSWPFSVYPTFASIEKEYTTTLLFKGFNSSGQQLAETIPLVSTDRAFQEYFQNRSRLRGFINQILNSDTSRGERSELLINLWLKEMPSSKPIHSVKTYQVQLSMDPAKNYDDFKVGKEIYEMKVTP